MDSRLVFYSLIKVMVVVVVVAWVGSNSGGVFAQGSPATGSTAVQVTKTLPKDVYAESGFRLPLPKRDDLDEYGKKVFDKMAGRGERSLRGLRGPTGIRMYSPKLAELSNALSQYLRFDAGFSGRIRELAILVTAREMDNQFEWAAHEPEALKEGLPKETVEVVKYRKGVEGLPETDAVIIQFGRQLFGQKKVNSETFARALKIFGSKRLVDLVSLMTNYSSTAALLDAFDMQLDPDQKPLLPVP